MATNVIMPQLGESVVEGTLSRWLKKEGDPVTEFEPLMEVNTDKVDTEIPAPVSGVVLKLYVQEGTTVKAGTLVAVIGQPGEAVPGNGHGAQPAVAAPLAPVAAPAAPSPRRDLGFISPIVARLADEYKVDLQMVTGTGQGGRITKKDVLDYVEQMKTGVAPAPAAPPPAAPAALPLTALAAPPISHLPPLTSDLQPAERTSDLQYIPVVGMRKQIAEHMVRSEHTAPHVTTVWEVDMSRVLAHRAANKAQFAHDGVDLTLTAYFVVASVAALKAVPIVNSQWAEDKILLKREVNVGVAVALDEGLIVPVIKNADEKSLLRIAREVNDLARRARAKALKPDDVVGGTFTISNHGVSGSLFATPIISQPQTGILGVGVMQKRVVVVSASGNDSIAIRPMVYVSLTFDHRVLDGAVADRFLAKLKETLEGWG
jgi:2-oxoglutarate dehydrogenase E2 component (dihydrolipoamide succinyltransferase)